VVPLITYPYWREVRTFPSWWAGTSRALLILAVLAGAALLVTSTIGYPRQIGGTDPAARGGWWLDYAEHATVLALAGVLAGNAPTRLAHPQRSEQGGMAIPWSGRRTGTPTPPRLVGSHRRRGCSSSGNRLRHRRLARLRT
jgi:hypothetical protein